jgi:hypothetical protein
MTTYKLYQIFGQMIEKINHKLTRTDTNKKANNESVRIRENLS